MVLSYLRTGSPNIYIYKTRNQFYPKTICGVVWQDHQFSFTNDGRSDRMTDLNAIQKAVDVALAVSRGKVRDVTGGALNYYAHKRVKPSWAKSGYRFILGEHTFVRLSGR